MKRYLRVAIFFAFAACGKSDTDVELSETTRTDAVLACNPQTVSRASFSFGGSFGSPYRVMECVSPTADADGGDLPYVRGALTFRDPYNGNIYTQKEADAGNDNLLELYCVSGQAWFAVYYCPCGIRQQPPSASLGVACRSSYFQQ